MLIRQKCLLSLLPIITIIAGGLFFFFENPLEENCEHSLRPEPSDPITWLYANISFNQQAEHYHMPHSTVLLSEKSDFLTEG